MKVYVLLFLSSTIFYLTSPIEYSSSDFQDKYYNEKICFSHKEIGVEDGCLTRYEIIMLLSKYKVLTYKLDSVVACQKKEIEIYNLHQKAIAGWNIYTQEKFGNLSDDYWCGSPYKNAEDFLEKNNIGLP
jgi:hypothetical protein